MKRLILALALILAPFSAALAATATFDYGATYMDFSPGLRTPGTTASITASNCQPICATITFNNTLTEDYKASNTSVVGLFRNSVFLTADDGRTMAWDFSYYVLLGERPDLVNFMLRDGVFGAFLVEPQTYINENTTAVIAITNPSYAARSFAIAKEEPSPVPLPATGLLLLGAMGLSAAAIRRRS